MQFLPEKKDNSKLRNAYKHEWLMTMFTNKDFMSDFSSVYRSILSKMVNTFLDDFL